MEKDALKNNVAEQEKSCCDEEKGEISSAEIDTDKSSVSLFKHTISSDVMSRRNEMPRKFYDKMVSDFRKETISSESTGNSTQNLSSESSSGWSPKRLHSRTRFAHVKSINSTNKSPNDSGKDKSKINTNVLNEFRKQTLKNRQRSLDREAIAEMNRQYDHNVCLDRFINDIEQVEQEKDDNSSPPPIQSMGGPQNNTYQSASIIGHSTNNSIHDSCSNCSNTSSGCPWCNNNTSGSSSVAPPSSGTESGDSRKSVSVNSTDKSSDKNCDDPTIDGSGEATTKKFNPVPMGLTSGKESEVDSGACVSATSLESTKTANLSGKNYKGGKPGRKRKREYIYNPKPVKEKKSKMTVPEHSKTQDYWEKRLRNNEAAKRSRELRRKKEVETRERFSQLQRENETLRKAIASLLKRNKTIDLILAEYEKSVKRNLFSSAEVVVSG